MTQQAEHRGDGGWAGKSVLVTGSAGFIGFHLCRRLQREGARVFGVDNHNPYYDVRLKSLRNDILRREGPFEEARCDLEDVAAMRAAWAKTAPEIVIHLAAQAGVRYSIDSPQTYVSSNLVGSFNVLELARHMPPTHLLMASTSSAYGGDARQPMIETDRSAHPLTLYAATKLASEAMGHSYAHLFGVPTTFFRFFSVYGPWGRPDMALYKFVRAIDRGEPIDVYNGGDLKRDFTYIDDLVEGIVRLAHCRPLGPAVDGDSLSPTAPFRLVNIGGGRETHLNDFINEIEDAVGRKAIRNNMPMQAGDVSATLASYDLLQRLTGFRPDTTVRAGVRAFVDWYMNEWKPVLDG